MMGFANALREPGQKLNVEANLSLERISSASRRMDELINLF